MSETWRFMTWRGCPFVPFVRLTAAQQAEARERFSPKGRRDGWENIYWWAWAVRKDGRLSRCPYIEPVGRSGGDWSVGKEVAA